ncbi:hypothetical protein NQ314_015799 [Rhamnusium bicolor]|uniref:PiggyBac transposable element-derived protein domain-containing protein n=1 Tax=Rhamnusium bicolor TaxID=1586634 RepID=A0AAV8WX48_9CUCU|nr:hypothetical protein NQ314_015799 [Rhamnusium bicolor]
MELMRELQKQKLTYVGTVKKSKRFIPLELMPFGEQDVNSSFFGFTMHETIVSFVQKKKRKSVILISSMHHAAEVDNCTKKPEIILFYNKTKVGVVSLDQKCANYSTSRRTRRWPMLLFHAFLNIAGVNSRVVFQCAQKGKEISRFEFLRRPGRDLCLPHMQNRLTITLPRSLKAIIISMVGDVNNTSTEPQKRGSASKRKRCAICPTKYDRNTNTYCEI